MTKEERIQNEIKRLTEIFKDLSENEFNSSKKLIENLAFMSATLDDLMDIVNNDKLIVETVNATQTFTKENPALTAYNKMYANYIKGLQQLISLLPEENKKTNNSDEPDELISYLKKKNKRLK